MPNVRAVAAVRVQIHFIMYNHYRFSETQMFGLSLQSSWRHIGLLCAVFYHYQFV